MIILIYFFLNSKIIKLNEEELLINYLNSLKGNNIVFINVYPFLIDRKNKIFKYNNIKFTKQQLEKNKKKQDFKYYLTNEYETTSLYLKLKIIKNNKKIKFLGFSFKNITSLKLDLLDTNNLNASKEFKTINNILILEKTKTIKHLESFNKKNTIIISNNLNHLKELENNYKNIILIHYDNFEEISINVNSLKELF